MKGNLKESCSRCGYCCSNHTPSLHIEDIQLIKKGILGHSDLYTLRRGERVYNNIEGKTTVLDTELIKIREKSDKASCVFYDEVGSACSIYKERPLQCRIFECWRPEPLIKLFKKQKLTRKDLISDKSLLEIIEYHQEKVSPERFHELLTSKNNPDKNRTELIEMINYDLYFRSYISEKLNFPSDVLDFYFGRSLLQCIKPYGYTIKSSEKDRYVLEFIQK